MEHKIKKTLSRDELSAYLHTLADALQNAEAVHDHPFVRLPTTFDKLELKCKLEAERFEVKFKVKTDTLRKPPTGDGPASPSDKPQAYKALKKRMQVTFKDLATALSKNQIPSEQLIHIFQEEVAEMIRFPDRGEPHYNAFEAACRHLTEACQNNRPGEVRQAFEVLRKMKKDCHASYK